MNDDRGPDRARILYVDDDTDLIAIYERFFENTGYDFKTALTAESGFDIAVAFRPDLIISDVILPGMNGMDFCRRLRGAENLKNTVVMLVTGMEVESEDLVAGFEAGADEYLIKPFSREEILARVHALLRIKRLQDDLDRVSVRLARVETENSRLKIELAKIGGDAAADGGADGAETGDPEKTVSMKLYEIKPGMKLAEGLYTVKGNTFLSENTVITEENIRQLTVYSREGLLEETVNVRK